MRTLKHEQPDKLARLGLEYVKALGALGLSQDEIGRQLLGGAMVFLKLDRLLISTEIDLENAIQALRDR